MDKKEDKKNKGAAGKDWAEMSDDGEDETEEQQQDPSTEKEKKKVPAAKKGFKNERGDYVVTSIDLPDMRVKKADD